MLPTTTANGHRTHWLPDRHGVQCLYQQRFSRPLPRPGGGRVALVIGAGCSFELPPGLPLSRQVWRELHDALVHDGILNAGECHGPDDLPVVAQTRNGISSCGVLIAII